MIPPSRNQTPVVNFLLNTRATKFDYSWIYGLEDKTVEKALHEHVLKFLDTKLLAKLPRVTTFFKFKSYLALVVAEQSATRTDPQSRPIFQRAMFLWKPVEEMYYRHLTVLARYLLDEANKVYEDLPDDAYRMPTRIRQFDLDIKELNRMSSKPRNKRSPWQLPEGSSWNDVLKRGLNVEVPPSWTFDRMIDGLADIPLCSSDVIHIGNALHFENRYPTDKSWIISAKTVNGDAEEIRVLDAQGRLIPIIKRTTYESSNSSVDSPMIDQPGHVANAGNNAAPTIEGKSREQPSNDKEISSEAETRELERLFLEFSNFSHNESEKIGIIRKLFFERYDVTLRSAETRILLLLIPAKHQTPSEIITSWHFLISEILLSYQNKNTDLVNEWIRRAYRLEDITNVNLPNVPTKWRSEFKIACETLRSILHDSL
jgi:hypothetical protein